MTSKEQMLATMRGEPNRRIPWAPRLDLWHNAHRLAGTLPAPYRKASLREMIDDELVLAHRKRGLTPDAPMIRGTAQNPDVFFQAREACNPFYEKVAGITQKAMDKFIIEKATLSQTSRG